MRVFLHGASVDTQGAGDGIGGLPAGNPLAYLLHDAGKEPRATDVLALRLRPEHPRLHSLRQPAGFLLGQGREQSKQEITHEFVVGREVCLRVRVEVHPTRREPLEVRNRRCQSLPREAVEGPEHHQVKLPAVGILEQPGELPAAIDALPTAQLFFSAAVATRREDHRKPRSGRAGQHRRWDRGRGK